MNTLIRYSNPGSTISDILDNIINSNMWDPFDNSISSDQWPRVDITESRDGYTLKADLPGIDKADVAIVVENGVLRIDGERKNDPVQEENMFRHFERANGKFSRSFSLPDDIDTEHLEAKMSNGVLTIYLHKVEKSKPKTIEVQVS